MMTCEVGQKDLGLGSRECGLTSRQKIFVHKTEVHHIHCPRFLSTRSLSTRVRSTTFAIAVAFTAVVSFARPRDCRQFSLECDFSNTTFVLFARERDLRQFIPVYSSQSDILKIEGKDFLLFAKHVPQFGIHCRLSIYGRLPTAGPTS